MRFLHAHIRLPPFFRICLLNLTLLLLAHLLCQDAERMVSFLEEADEDAPPQASDEDWVETHAGRGAFRLLPLSLRALRAP